MKRFIGIGLALMSYCMLSAFIHNPEPPSSIKNIKRDFVQLNEKLLFSKYEVSNGDYKQFMAYLKNTNRNNLFIKCLLDTTAWDTKNNNRGYKNTYHTRKAFDNYPVVTISYEAANEYCRWLTEQYHSDANRQFKKVSFRLPTESEWMEAASGGNKNKLYPWDNFYLRNNKGEFLCNFLQLGEHAIYFDSTTKSYKVADVFIENRSTALLFSEVNAFAPSPSGLYNLSGNAAEMVAEKGLAKGGSYNDPGFDVRISSKKYYDEPSTEIGFRVVMEVLEK
jgi:formylglycine-generating enzyme required for sulfatase activity